MTADQPLLHPIVLGAIAVMIVNDHVLKYRYPGLVTGKLSDVAGMIFFPVVLHVLYRGVARVGGARDMPGRASLVGCAIATAIVFTAVKTWAPATRAYEVALGVLQWPFQAAGALIRGASPEGLRKVVAVRDASDLLALPFIGVGLLVAASASRKRPTKGG